jgi:nucleoside-diphosphate-sugar epimerase
MADEIPEKIISEEQLDDFLSKPSPRLIEMMAGLEGDIIILGVGGKMGVSLGVMARRAINEAGACIRVTGVSRFSDPGAGEKLEKAGVETIQCDLLERTSVSKLPLARNVIFMAGRKFGTGGNEDETWALNTVVPANTAEHFAESRIVVFSTGCVYPLVTASTGGCTETDPPGPVGEYAQSCLGRERVFEHNSRRNGTPLCLFRLNYAIDLRYGVLHDIARAVLDSRPVPVTAPHFNVIWQGDAIERALLCLEHCASPPDILNVTGDDTASTRSVAQQFGELMDRDVRFTGEEQPCYLSNASKSLERFGTPAVLLDRMIKWQAYWLMSGRRSLNKPTHFEVTDGKY